MECDLVSLEITILTSHAAIDVPYLERFIEDIQKRLPELDFEGKRLALDMHRLTLETSLKRQRKDLYMM